jgi:hypothetical protein
MAAISSIDANQPGPFVAAAATLTASDTITFDDRKKQLLVLRNGTGGALTVKIDGSLGTSVNVPGVGTVSVAAGLDIPLAIGEQKAVVLSSVSAYCQGVVTLTGGTGASLTLFNL